LFYKVFFVYGMVFWSSFGLVCCFSIKQTIKIIYFILRNMCINSICCHNVFMPNYLSNNSNINASFGTYCYK